VKLLPLISIKGTSRAAHGRRLAATALSVQLLVTLGLFGLVAMIEISMNQDASFTFVSGVINAAFLLVALGAVAKNIFWLAALWCLPSGLDILSSMNAFNQSPTKAIAELSNATLSFVYICGILIWVRNRRLEPVPKASSSL
jgi:hypothetical protein